MSAKSVGLESRVQRLSLGILAPPQTGCLCGAFHLGKNVTIHRVVWAQNFRVIWFLLSHPPLSFSLNDINHCIP